MELVPEIHFLLVKNNESVLANCLLCMLAVQLVLGSIVSLVAQSHCLHNCTHCTSLTFLYQEAGPFSFA